MKRMSKKTYEAPHVEIIAIEQNTVLCASAGLFGNSTESVPTVGFDIL